MNVAERYVAFLRAINVGGRVVKMDRLRELFEAVPLSNVETFIASGNVAFESRTKDPPALEKKIEARLYKALGYDVETFIRSAGELARIADVQPFDDLTPEHSLLIGFLAVEPTAIARASTSALRTEVDDFHVNGREVYWRCRTRLTETLVSGPRLAKTLGMPTTFRNVTTIRRLIAKYPAARPSF
jgi:uncharacterized protein (DUF1697 family)